MSTETLTESRRRDRETTIAAAVTAVAVVAVALWWTAPWHAATPVTLRGEAVYAIEGKGYITFIPDSRVDALRFAVDHRGEGFAGTLPGWVGPDNRHHTKGRIPCLERGAPAPVELSFVEVRAHDGPGSGRRLATGVRCLD